MLDRFRIVEISAYREFEERVGSVLEAVHGEQG